MGNKICYLTWRGYDLNKTKPLPKGEYRKELTSKW